MRNAISPAPVHEETSAATAFDAFAPFYDTLTGHQDYAWWWSVLLPLVEAAGVPGRRVLDVACGTGKSLEVLLAQGWSGAGVDGSAGMLAQARRKLGSAVPLAEHDMRELPALGEFDLVCCLCDAINDVHDERELVATFSGFRRNLVAGGVVVFDANTIRTFRAYRGGALVHQAADRVLVVEGRVDDDPRPGGLLQLDFVALERDGEHLWRCRRSSHLQRHHPDAEVRRALSAAGLELVAVRGLGMRLEDSFDEERDEKAMYVARVPRGKRREVRR